MGTTVHKKLGNVHVGLAIAFLVGSGLGVTGGGILNRELFNFNPVLSNLVISAIYVVMLGFLGFYALYDYLKAVKTPSTGRCPWRPFRTYKPRRKGASY